jgi:hypothetical protein
MVVMKIPRHDGTAYLVKADMMIGRHSAPLVMNLPLWFGSGQPEQARLSSMNHNPLSPMPPPFIGVARKVKWQNRICRQKRYGKMGIDEIARQ